MLRAYVHVELNRNSGLAQLERIGDVFVAEDVQLSDFDVRGRRSVTSAARAGAAVGGTSSWPSGRPVALASR